MANNWTYEETVVAFWAYCRIPFKESRASHPEVMRIAKILGRTPAALNMKIGNIGRLDPSLADKGITGLTHGAQLEKTVWKAFADNPTMLALESQRIMAKMQGKSIEESSEIDLTTLPQGGERETIVRQRIGQSFFRTAVLTSYNNHCCISGVGNQPLLEACHIADWAENDANRTNPCNGLCLNPFFHKAYDKNFIGISPDYIIHTSDALLDETEATDFRMYLRSLNGKQIVLPERFLPNRDLLDIHYQKYKMAV